MLYEAPLREQPYQGNTNEWFTPPWIVESLGPFQLDPCTSDNRPWDTAAVHYSKKNDGLISPWFGFVWCNPPYGPHASDWLRKMSEHNNGIALTFARTETEAFSRYVWDRASAIFFFKGRLKFFSSDGLPAPYSAAAPSVLIGWGDWAVDRLKNCGQPGKLVLL